MSLDARIVMLTVHFTWMSADVMWLIMSHMTLYDVTWWHVWCLIQSTNPSMTDLWHLSPVCTSYKSPLECAHVMSMCLKEDYDLSIWPCQTAPLTNMAPSCSSSYIAAGISSSLFLLTLSLFIFLSLSAFLRVSLVCFFLQLWQIVVTLWEEAVRFC